jgi:hypothetical protein
LAELAVPGSSWPGWSVSQCFVRVVFVSLCNLFYDIMWMEYVVNKMQVEFWLSSEEHFLQNEVKHPSCQTRWSPLQNGICKVNLGWGLTNEF